MRIFIILAVVMMASQKGLQFLARINQSFNFQYTSAEIGLLLTRASQELWDDLNGYRNKKQTTNRPLPNSFQSNAFIIDALQPFMRRLNLVSDVTGFVANPADFIHLEAVNVFKDSACGDDGSRIPVNLLREDEVGTNEWSQYFTPNWKEGTNRFMWHQPRYRVVAGGIEILPRRLYNLVEFSYLIYPTEIKIRNNAGSDFAWEFDNYNGNPNFVIVNADVNTLFKENLHNEIVNRAVLAASLQNPDYTQVQAETANLRMTT